MALREGITLYATLHAANASYRAHQDRTAAMWTGAASVVPGVGQAINGNWWEAAGFAAVWMATAAWTTDMERRYYSNADEEKSVSPVSGEKISWSFAILPMGIVANATW